MGKAGIDANLTLDCSGLACPLPVIKTAQEISRIEVGEILKVISTDAGSEVDMEAWVRQTGHELLDSQQQDGYYIFYFRRTK